MERIVREHCKSPVLVSNPRAFSHRAVERSRSSDHASGSGGEIQVLLIAKVCIGTASKRQFVYHILFGIWMDGDPTQEISFRNLVFLPNSGFPILLWLIYGLFMNLLVYLWIINII